MMEQDVVRLERQMVATEKDVAARQDTQGDKFRIVLEGKVFTDRVKAGSALIYLVDAIAPTTCWAGRRRLCWASLPVSNSSIVQPWRTR